MIARIQSVISDIDFLLWLNAQKPTKPPPELISEYVNKKRKMPAGSPRPGPMNIHYTPYTIEIMDCMSPYSGINRVSVLKGVQIALTTAAENVIAYYMDAAPAEIIYCTATLDLLKKWRKRLEGLINSCGYRDKISAQETTAGSRKTGDTDNSKEYPGGSLSMTSLQSPSGQRSESNQILIVDEADGAPATHTSGEGAYLGTLEGRTVAYGNKYKIFELSTAALLENSVINPQFLEGDQRYYNVPCLKCGRMMVLKFEQLRPIYDKLGRLDHVFYECECNGQLFNNDKTEMMRVDNAKWIPTAIARDPAHRSYQISALYSPVGMLSWHRIYDFYLKSEDNPDRKPSFVNLYLGLPYKEDGQRPDITKKNKLRGDYKSGTVPHGVLYLTMASDVQRGKEAFQAMTGKKLTAEIAKMKSKGVNLWKAKLPRIEMEVLGVGARYRSWMIEYKVFYGHTTHGPYEGAFEEMYQWIQETQLKYFRSDGVAFTPRISLMDASDGMSKSAVFEFQDRVGMNAYPNVNDGWLKKKKDPGIDEETRFNYDRYRLISKGQKDIAWVNISTNHYKKQVYERIVVERELDGGEDQRAAFCEFHKDTPDHYFKMLTNAEQLNDGTFRDGGKPVEALDIRSYNLCGADIWIDSRVAEGRNELKKAGYGDEELKKFDKKVVLKRLENELAVAARKIKL